MKDNRQHPIEDQIRNLAGRFKYPPTPDVSVRVRTKLDAARPGRHAIWKPAVALLLLLLLVLFSVPAVRASVIEFFQVGVVRIFPVAVTPLPSTASPNPAATIPSNGTDLPLPDPLLNLAGKTTLEDARQQAGFTLRLPAYPSNLGLPDIVYHQDNLNMVILVWLEPGDSQKVRLSLYALGPGSIALKKTDLTTVRETTVNGQYALWANGPHLLEIQGADYQWRRLVNGNVLVWEVNGITYRLETDLSMEAAIQIAESLHE